MRLGGAQFGVQIAAIGQIEFLAVPFGGVAEEAELRAGEPFQSERGGGKGGSREEDRQGFDAQFRFTAAKIIQPNQSVSERGGGFGRAGRGADDGHAALALSE